MPNQLAFPRKKSSQKSIMRYQEEIETRTSTLINQYINLSKKIYQIIADYKSTLTDQQDQEKGWLFPYPENCAETPCLECPHKVTWKATFFLPGKNKWLATAHPVSSGVIRMSPSKNTRKNKDTILQTYKELNALLRQREEIRYLLRGTTVRMETVIKKTKAQVE